MNAITRHPIDLNALLQRAHHPQAGAVVFFCGDIRNHSGGQAVVALEYEAHESMALKQIEHITTYAFQHWGLHHLEVVHRFGRMNVGECSVAIAVAASHRSEAYAANRYVIDTIKHTVPIWKRELFADGSSAWSQGCAACALHELTPIAP